MQIKSSDKIPFEELSLICYQVTQCHRLQKDAELDDNIQGRNVPHA